MRSQLCFSWSGSTSFDAAIALSLLAGTAVFVCWPNPESLTLTLTLCTRRLVDAPLRNPPTKMSALFASCVLWGSPAHDSKACQHESTTQVSTDTVAQLGSCEGRVNKRRRLAMLQPLTPTLTW